MTHHERDDRQALAAGETYLIHVLETSDPPGNPDHYRITDAVEAHHASTGSYDVEAGGLGVLGRHTAGVAGGAIDHQGLHGQCCQFL